MKKFQLVDLSEVTPSQRNVLALTLPELLNLYCDERPCKRPHLRNYRLRKWIAQFRDFDAWSLTPAHILAMARCMEAQGYAASTINRDMADISGCYAWAIRKSICPDSFRSPTREYVRAVEKVRRVELTEYQLRRLLIQAKLSHWPKLYPLILLALHSGGRKGELKGLKWGDVDMNLRRASLHETKAGNPRRLLLTSLVCDALLSIRPDPYPHDALVFCGRNPFKPYDFRRAWNKCRVDAGLPDLHFHDLRHVSAASMLKAGHTLHAVAQVLGHRDTRMLAKVYGHLDDRHLQKTVEDAWETTL